MIRSSVTTNVLQLMEEITTAGPLLPEYDGMRAFDHRERIRLHLMGQRDRVTPATLDLWPSLTCNALCPLCQYRVSGAREEVDRTGRLAVMSVQRANAIFAGAARAKVLSVILTGGGEPTLNPALVSIAGAARHNGLQWSLNTNAFTIDADLARDLLREEPSYIKISVDAGSAEMHGQIYNVSRDYFERVLHNTIVAVRTSGEMKQRKIGVSFTLGARTSDEELDRIRDVTEHILRETNGALGFAVFRARILHYRQWLPVVPQPSFARFENLANAIDARIIEPLAPNWPGTRFDMKKGLFMLAAREAAPRGSLSNSWMTTITHEGDGYATGELAGARESQQLWGRVGQVPDDFVFHWNGRQRVNLHRQIESGEIPLPIVHRTSPVDEFLQRLNTVVGEAVPGPLADEIIQAVSTAPWYRSKNSGFV